MSTVESRAGVNAQVLFGCGVGTGSPNAAGRHAADRQVIMSGCPHYAIQWHGALPWGVISMLIRLISRVILDSTQHPFTSHGNTRTSMAPWMAPVHASSVSMQYIHPSMHLDLLRRSHTGSATFNALWLHAHAWPHLINQWSCCSCCVGDQSQRFEPHA